jgi:hypothetical protein
MLYHRATGEQLNIFDFILLQETDSVMSLRGNVRMLTKDDHQSASTEDVPLSLPPACSAEATAAASAQSPRWIPHTGRHTSADRAQADQLGRNVFELFADLFTDAMLL